MENDLTNPQMNPFSSAWLNRWNSEQYEYVRRTVNVIASSFRNTQIDNDDVVQNITLRVYNQLRQHKVNEENIRPYLYQMIRNALIDEIRHSAKRKHISLEDESVRHLAVNFRSPDKIYEELDYYENCLKKLTPKEYLIVLLMREGYSTQEVADYLKMKRNALYKALFEIRKKFKNLDRTIP